MIITGDAKLVASAFVKARGAMNATVSKDGKGNYGKYATLAAIVEATAAPFAQHGLAIIQEASIDEGGVTIDTWLIHESGGTIEFEALTMSLTDRKPQTVGSAITYARRYQLASVCGLAPDDDDGQAAQDGTKTTQKGKEPPAGNSGHDDALWEPETRPEGSRDDAPKTLSPAQLTRLNILGVDAYGKAWDEQRPKVVEWVSKGAVASSKELTPLEASRLIKALEKKIRDDAAAKPAPEQEAAQAEPEKETA